MLQVSHYHCVRKRGGDKLALAQMALLKLLLGGII